jgi:hypothetical protein
LDQDRSDDHFEGRPARPPVLLAVRLKQRLKILRQYGQDFRCRRGVRPRTVGAGLPDRCAGAGGSGQSGARTHLFRTISTPCGQVKNTTLSFVSAPCSTVQVLANSQRGVKIGQRADSVFAMFGVGCTISREHCGCLSV